MGTINCIGVEKNGNLLYANSKLEVYQKTIINNDIEFWYAQNNKGKKILQNIRLNKDEILNSSFVKGIIDCICKSGCPLCRGSRKTTKKEMKSYQDWQIEEFKRKI